MNIQELVGFLENSQVIGENDIKEFADILAYAPYCTPIRLLYLKGLKQTESIHYARELKKAAVYVNSPRQMYEFLQDHAQEEKVRVRKPKHSADYFGMLEQLKSSGNETGELQQLALKLKQARENLQAEPVVPIVQKNNEQPLLQQDEIKNCIKEERYADAIEILRQLNLNNPKKSAYFADQIRFLQKVMENKGIPMENK